MSKNREYGIIRKVDKLGRVTIPMEWRKLLGLGSDQNYEIKCYDDHIEIMAFGGANNGTN